MIFMLLFLISYVQIADDTDAPSTDSDEEILNGLFNEVRGSQTSHRRNRSRASRNRCRAPRNGTASVNRTHPYSRSK